MEVLGQNYFFYIPYVSLNDLFTSSSASKEEPSLAITTTTRKGEKRIKAVGQSVNQPAE